MSVNSKLVERRGRKAKGSKVLSNTMIAWLPHLLCVLNLPTFRLAGFSLLFYLIHIDFLDLKSCV
jgi:hypothetical protein